MVVKACDKHGAKKKSCENRSRDLSMRISHVCAKEFGDRAGLEYVRRVFPAIDNEAIQRWLSLI